MSIFEILNIFKQDDVHNWCISHITDSLFFNLFKNSFFVNMWKIKTWETLGKSFYYTHAWVVFVFKYSI